MKKMIYALALLHLVYAQKHNQNQRALTNSNITNNQTSSRSLSIPKTLSYQGLLTKDDGKPVDDGIYQITFRFYNSLEAVDFIWEQEQNIEIEDGLISATLDSVNFSSDGKYLEIIVEGIPLDPRQKMTSVLSPI